MGKSLNQRNIVVCDPRLQYRSLLLPLIVATTTAITLCIFFVFLTGGLQEFASDEEALRNATSRVQIQTAIAVGAVLVVHIVLVVWLGLLASHRIAGPIYRIRKTMAEVTKGNMNVRVHLRDGDKLGEVADTFNEMMDSLADRIAPDEPEGEVEKLPEADG